MKIIILAGGKGFRLWPFSTENHPKQFIKLQNGLSTLQQTVKRFVDRGYVENIFIVTSAANADIAKEQLDAIEPSLKNQLLIEPCSRNTASAIAWAVRHLLVTHKAKDTDTILTLPSDHHIEDPNPLVEKIKETEPAAREGYIVAFGIAPKKSDTGFGYIRVTEKATHSTYYVDSFIEKPGSALADKLIQNNDWLWNIGVYMFTPKTFISELETHQIPLAQFMRAESHHEDYLFRSLSPLSIDRAIIEKSHNLRAAKIDNFSWVDIGSWDQIYQLFEKDENQNVKIGHVVEHDTRGSLILADKKVISTIGVDNLIIVETPEAIFVSTRDDASKVKNLMEKIQNIAEEKKIQDDERERLSSKA